MWDKTQNPMGKRETKIVGMIREKNNVIKTLYLQFIISFDAGRI
jgi:hypothetical protein